MTKIFVGSPIIREVIHPYAIEQQNRDEQRRGESEGAPSVAPQPENQSQGKHPLSDARKG